MSERHYYSHEEIETLRVLVNSCKNTREMAARFNRDYGTDIKPLAIKAICERRGISLERFRSAANLERAYNENFPVGTEMIGSASFGGHVIVKTDNKRAYTTEGYLVRNAITRKNWRRKCELVYEQSHGEIPKGGIVVFLNQNKFDFRPENLYCISRKIHAMMCKNRWYVEDGDLTLTAIKWCEHKCALLQAVSCGGKDD